MRILLFILAIFAGLAGFSLISMANSAVQESTTVGFLIICAVLLGSAGIIDTMLLIEKRLKELIENNT